MQNTQRDLTLIIIVGGESLVGCDSLLQFMSRDGKKIHRREKKGESIAKVTSFAPSSRSRHLIKRCASIPLVRRAGKGRNARLDLFNLQNHFLYARQSGFVGTPFFSPLSVAITSTRKRQRSINIGGGWSRD